MEINQLLKLMVSKGASDLHLTVPSAPVLRVNGELHAQENFAPVSSEDLQAIFEEVTTQEQRDIFAKQLELDFAYSVPGLARLRINVLQQRGTLSLALRLVSFNIPTIDELELPQILKKLILKPKGLILVTGTAGSGKSTTMAAMIGYLNENASRNVITIEDPIEYLFQNKKCLIRQRDLGDDTRSFYNALQYGLRHDPDVLVIGELRDLNTISTVVRAAETGRLVISTLNSPDSIKALDILIDVFPADQKQKIRLQLSEVMVAVINQVLLPRVAGGRIASCEVMINNGQIKKLIQKEKGYEILASIEAAKAEGMQTMDQSLAELLKKKVITLQDALDKCVSPVKLQNLI
jgi:twitching motility protein PilT